MHHDLPLPPSLRHNGWGRHPSLGSAQLCTRSVSKSPLKELSTDGSASEPSLFRDIATILESNPSFAKQLERSLTKENHARISKIVEEEVSVAEASVERPSNRDLGLVCLQGMIPFVAFGFIDNMVLIIAGEYIDITFGVLFGISTMAAAALGNIVSDLLGIGLGNIVETWANRLGLPAPNITRIQERLPLTRRVFYSGNGIGMLIGCLLGMFPLLFIDSEKTARLKRQSKIDHLFQSVVD